MHVNKDEEVSLTLWKPEAYLDREDLSLNSAERILSRIFNKDDFVILKSEFEYLLKILNLEMSGFKLSPAPSAPKISSLNYYFGKNGINCLVIPDKSVKTLVKLFFGAEVTYSSEFIEYLARRFIYLLSQSRAFCEAKYVPDLKSKTSFAYTFLAEIFINDQLLDFFILLNESFANTESKTTENLVGKEYSIILGFLSVPLAELDDYLSPESVIDLEIPITSRAYLKLDGVNAVTGVLINADGKWAFKPTSKDKFRLTQPEGKALVQLELFKVKVEDIKTLLERGDVLISDFSLSPSCNIKVGEESLAKGQIYVFDQKLALVIN